MNEELAKLMTDSYDQGVKDALESIKEGLDALPKREWVGLTDEEIKEIIGSWGDTPVKGYTRKLFDQIEAKLRSKNNG